MRKYFIAIMFGLLVPMTSFASGDMKVVQLKIENSLLVSKQELKLTKVKIKVDKDNPLLKTQLDSIKNVIKDLEKDLDTVKDAIKAEEKLADVQKDFNKALMEYNNDYEKYANIVHKYVH